MKINCFELCRMAPFLKFVSRFLFCTKEQLNNSIYYFNYITEASKFSTQATILHKRYCYENWALIFT